jgi:hypothetical protein
MVKHDIFVHYMKNKLTQTCLLGLLAFTAGCKTDNDQPPGGQPTDYGKISFLLNGDHWQSEPGGAFMINTENDTFPGIHVSEFKDSFSLLTCRKSDSSVFSLKIFLLVPGRTGDYRDSTRRTTTMAFNEKMNNPSSDQRYIHKKMRVEITSWDETNRRFSGNFQAEMRSVSGNKTIYISNGKFENVLFQKK